ncbi:hypothetical protein CPB83DRAFT_368308 [Crepidotus variabilis]|uniref:Uncharacterized protein n=1 Tax=Crepidotus variabilis TaxID=179855 RepID=A0A9P6JPS0_9AGAR|nr:hypothetical protein CPB83DRAFT_368308 [Crepidotus variabilis]
MSTLFVGSSTMPNPLAPEAWQAASDAANTRITCYVPVGCLAIIIWDMLQFLPEDLTLVFFRRFAFHTLLFIVNRAVLVVWFTTTIVVMTTELHHIKVWHWVTSIAFISTHCCTGLLFLYRISIIYKGSRWVIHFFAVLWVILLGSSITVPLTTENRYISPTLYAKSVMTKEYGIFAGFMQSTYDSLICIAIVYKLGSEVVHPNRRGWRSRFLMRRASFRRLRSRLVQDNEIYLLFSICIRLPELIFFFVNHNPAIRYLIVYPDLLVMSTLASRIYRQMRLGQPGLLERGRNGEAIGFSNRWRPGSAVAFADGVDPSDTHELSLKIFGRSGENSSFIVDEGGRAAGTSDSENGPRQSRP